MSSLATEIEIADIISITVTKNFLIINLDHGGSLSTPTLLYPRLNHTTDGESALMLVAAMLRHISASTWS